MRRETLMRKPADCTTMAEIRAEIDRLDEDLVRLFAERAGYIDRAAEIKANPRSRSAVLRVAERTDAALPEPTAPRRAGRAR